MATVGLCVATWVTQQSYGTLGFSPMIIRFKAGQNTYREGFKDHVYRVSLLEVAEQL